MTEQELTQIVIKKPEEATERQIKDRFDRLAKPLDGLGVFEDMLKRIGAVNGDAGLSLDKKAVIVMCADNGVVEERISQSGQQVTARVAEAMGRRESSVCRMAAAVAADVIPVDIGICQREPIPGVLPRKVACGTKNFAKEPAMTKQEALQAISVGMELAGVCKERGYRLLATGEMGIGNTTTSSAVAAALLSCEVSAVTGKGAGLSAEGLRHKIEVIEQALRKYRLRQEDTLAVLAAVGGLDIAGLAGVFLGGAVYGIPVVIDGVISAVAALTAERLCPGTKEYVIASHQSREPAAARILDKLNARPVLNADLALGEGTGAVMLFGLLDVARAVYINDTTFEDIRVEQYKRY